jgi:hypothetical protein
MKRAHAALAFASTLLSLSGCTPRATRLDVEPPAVGFTSAGNVVVLKVTPRDKEGAPAPSPEVCAFFSSSPSIVEARQDGAVRGLSTGSAEVRVSCGRLTAVVPVKVSLPATVAFAPACEAPACSLLGQDPLSLRLEGMGASARLNGTALDERGQGVAVSLRYEAADPEFQPGARKMGIAVSQQGEVRAIGVGKFIVLAQAGGALGKAMVEARLPAVDVVQAARGFVLRPGAQVAIGARTFQRSRRGLVSVAGAPLVYSSSNAAVARVSDDGRITALGAGQAEVVVAADTGSPSPAFAQIQVRVLALGEPEVAAPMPAQPKPVSNAKAAAKAKRGSGAKRKAP